MSILLPYYYTVCGLGAVFRIRFFFGSGSDFFSESGSVKKNRPKTGVKVEKNVFHI